MTQAAYLRTQAASILEELGTLPYSDMYTEELEYRLQRIQYQLSKLI